MGLVPGVSLAQWIGTRLAARSLAYAARFLSRGNPQRRGVRPAENSAVSEFDNLESAEGGISITPTASYPSGKNALGLEGF